MKKVHLETSDFVEAISDGTLQARQEHCIVVELTVVVVKASCYVPLVTT